MKKLSLFLSLLLTATAVFGQDTVRLEVPAGVAPKQSYYSMLRNRMQRTFSFGNQHKVHFVYLVPSDKQPVATAAIQGAVVNLQAWYKREMGNGKTFTLNNPNVQVFQTDHPASWYSTHDNGGAHASYFWINSIDECNRYAGSNWYQEFDDWVIYVDADPAPDQYAGGTSAPGAFSGFAVLGGRDIKAILGQDPEWTYQREIGGLGHEYGHTHGLPHPPAGPDFGRAIMGTGYMIYPTCVLLQANKDQLNGNPFFAVAPNTRPAPTPRPRPTPKPRQTSHTTKPTPPPAN